MRIQDTKIYFDSLGMNLPRAQVTIEPFVRKWETISTSLTDQIRIDFLNFNTLLFQQKNTLLFLDVKDNSL